MKRRRLLYIIATGVAVVVMPTLAVSTLPQVEVFKSPYCGCCGAWVDHLKTTGFPVKVTEVDDTAAARKRYGMPDRFGSCHTAIVNGYDVFLIDKNGRETVFAHYPKS